MLAHDVVEASTAVSSDVIAVDETFDDRRIDLRLMADEHVAAMGIDLAAVVDVLVSAVSDQQPSMKLGWLRQLFSFGRGVRGNRQPHGLVAPQAQGGVQLYGRRADGRVATREDLCKRVVDCERSAVVQQNVVELRQHAAVQWRQRIDDQLVE